MPESAQRWHAAGRVLVSLALGLAAVGCVATAGVAPDAQDFTQVERGHYLVTAGDCAGCHTAPGGAAFAGGRSIETPFGRMLSANITPDVATGIGAWTDDAFDAAVRRGRLPDGSRLYPAMPYPYYTRLSRADVIAMRAYLKTLPAVHAAVETDQLPFPFRLRLAMWVWDGLFFTPGEFRADPGKSAAWNRGAFLVQGPGHCGACHTPKNLLGADEGSHFLAGYAVQHWFAPELSGGAAGLKRWSREDLIAYLQSGHNRFAAAAGPMAEEVANSSSKMTPEDLAAIAEFLQDQRGVAAPASPLAASDASVQAGAAIYADLCASCHRLDGTGVPALFPDLAASASVGASDPTSVLHVILHGTRSVATDREPTGPAMPGFGGQLSDAQVAAVANYVRNSWGHGAPAVSDSAVQDLRRIPADDIYVGAR